jgi:hypothetical protein
VLNSRIFDEPAVREAQQALTATAAADPQFETVLMEAVGRWSACDIFIQADQREWLDVEFAIRTEAGPVVSELGRKFFRDLDFPYQPEGAGIGRVSGILFSIRGRPSDKFTLVALPRGTALATSRAFFRMRVWSEDGFYGDREGLPPVQPFAGRSQILQNNVTLVAGPNVIFPGHPDRRRNYITRVVIGNDPGAATTGPYILEDSDPAGVITPIASYFLGPDAGTWVQDEFTFAARGSLAGTWQITAPAPGGVVVASCTGFAE